MCDTSFTFAFKQRTEVLDGAPSTVANKLAGLRWWVVYQCLIGALVISPACLRALWMDVAHKMTQLSKLFKRDQQLKSMGGIQKYAVYVRVRTSLNLKIDQVNCLLSPFALRGEVLAKDDEDFCVDVLVSALVLLSAKRAENVQGVVDVRATPIATGKSPDQSALRVAGRDLYPCVCVLPCVCV